MGKTDINHALSFGAGAEHETPEAVMIQTAEAHVLRDPRYPTAAAAAAMVTSVTEETSVAAIRSPNVSLPDYVLNPMDRTVLVDHHGRPVTVDRMLATKPLRGELLTRPGPGGRKLVYLAGESVTRTLNDIFGFDGWHLQILKTEQTVCVSEENAKKVSQWHVAYMAQVRITHRQSGTYKEDLGAGDAVDRHLPTAVQHAMKASITDALKRAARHFGDKLGNSLYQGNFNINNAPKSLQEALDQYDQERARVKFGEIRTNALSRTSNGRHETAASVLPATTQKVVSVQATPHVVSISMSMPSSAKHPSPDGTSAAVLPKFDHNVVPKLHHSVTQQRHSLPERLSTVVAQQQQQPSMVGTATILAVAATTTTLEQQQRSPLMNSSVVNTMTTMNKKPATANQQQHMHDHPRPPIIVHNNPPLTAAQGLQNSMFTTGSSNNKINGSSDWLPRPETSAGRRKAPFSTTSTTTIATTTAVATTTTLPATHGCDVASAPKKPRVNNPYSASA